MRCHRTSIAFAFFFAASSPARSVAQQAAPAQEEYWVVSSFQVDWPKMDSLQKLMRAYVLPVADEAKKLGVVLDYRILIHAYAGRDNVVLMQKFSSFAAIHSDTTWIAAIRRITPDSTKRKAIQDAFNAIIGSGLHHDEIYTEVTKQ